ncbi:MAG: polysaccharide biosynthesis tyrosine autokinase [Caldilineaceae bacterium]
MNNVDISSYLRPLLKWWWLLGVATLIAAFSSFIYTVKQPLVYQARTTVIVGSTIQDPNPDYSRISLAGQLAAAYADMATRTPIRQATMTALKTDQLPYYNVSVAPNTQIIEIDVYDLDPNRAYVVANELVNQLILFGPKGREEAKRQDFIKEQVDKLEKGIKETEGEIARKQEQLSTLFSARELANTQTQITALQTKLTTLQANYAALLTNTQHGAANALNILEPASLPTEPIGSNLATNVLVAALLGFFLAAAGAYVIEYLDDSVKSAEDLQKTLGVTVLSTIPQIPSSGEGDARLVMVNNSSVPAMEAYRLLRTNLQFTMIDRILKLLVVTSSSPREGKSLTAANLSAAMARAGKRVVLVDADMHRPTQHRLFKLINNMGLTTALLNDQLPLDSLLQATTVPELLVLTTGPLPPNPAELLSSRRMHEILAKLTDRFDIVILDTPPIMAVSDAIILASFTDATLLVTRFAKTRRDLAKQALNALRQVNAHVSGIVLNGIAVGKSGYYNYGYYSDYNSLPKVMAAKPEQFTEPAPEPATVAQLAKYIHPIPEKQPEVQLEKYTEPVQEKPSEPPTPLAVEPPPVILSVSPDKLGPSSLPPEGKNQRDRLFKRNPLFPGRKNGQNH